MKLVCPMPKCDDTGKLILRVMVSGLMLVHGTTKLMNGIDWLVGMLAGMGLPGFIAYGVFVGEIVGALMVLLGWRARIGAVLMAGNMVVAVALMHGKELFSLNNTGGYALELQMFYFLTAVAIFVMGAGKYALSTKSSWD